MHNPAPLGVLAVEIDGQPLSIVLAHSTARTFAGRVAEWRRAEFAGRRVAGQAGQDGYWLIRFDGINLRSYELDAVPAIVEVIARHLEAI